VVTLGPGRYADGNFRAGRLAGRPLVTCSRPDSGSGIGHLRPLVHVMPQP
jgi:hypothetical protein